MFGAVVLALVQVVDHPSPFKTLAEIASLYEKFGSLEVLMPAVVLIHILPISEHAGVNQTVNTVC